MSCWNSLGFIRSLVLKEEGCSTSTTSYWFRIEISNKGFGSLKISMLIFKFDVDEMLQDDWIAKNSVFDSDWPNFMRDIGRSVGGVVQPIDVLYYMPIPESPQTVTKVSYGTSQMSEYEEGSNSEYTLLELGKMNIIGNSANQQYHEPQQQMVQLQPQPVNHAQPQQQPQQKMIQQQTKPKVRAQPHHQPQQQPQQQLQLQMLQLQPQQMVYAQPQQQPKQQIAHLQPQQMVYTQPQQHPQQQMVYAQPQQQPTQHEILQQALQQMVHAQLQQQMLQQQPQQMSSHLQFLHVPTTSNALYHPCDSQSWNHAQKLPDTELNNSSTIFVPVYYHNNEQTPYFEINLSHYPMTSVPEVPVNTESTRNPAPATDIQQRRTSVIKWTGPTQVVRVRLPNPEYGLHNPQNPARGQEPNMTKPDRKKRARTKKPFKNQRNYTTDIRPYDVNYRENSIQSFKQNNLYSTLI